MLERRWRQIRRLNQQRVMGLSYQQWWCLQETSLFAWENLEVCKCHKRQGCSLGFEIHETAWEFARKPGRPPLHYATGHWEDYALMKLEAESRLKFKVPNLWWFYMSPFGFIILQKPYTVHGNHTSNSELGSSQAQNLSHNPLPWCWAEMASTTPKQKETINTQCFIVLVSSDAS